MKPFFFFILFAFCNSLCFSQGSKFDEILSKADKPPVVMQIFSQTFTFSWPKGFTLGGRSENQGSFTQIFKTVGESEEAWTQRILLSGMQGASLKDPDPIKLMSNLIKIINKNSCPTSYSVTDVGEMKIQSGQTAFVFMVGCGIKKPTESSEKNKTMTMAVVIKGDADAYALQWIERSSTDAIPPLDWPIWRTRLDSLLPLHVH